MPPFVKPTRSDIQLLRLLEAKIEDQETKQALHRVLSLIDEELASSLIIEVKAGTPNNEKRTNTRRRVSIEIRYQNTAVPLHFGSRDATMVYICALLKRKAGLQLKRADFRCFFTKSGITIKRSEAVVWMNSVYNYVYPLCSVNFDDWYAKLRQDKGHRISQGKTVSNRAIKEMLKDMPQFVVDNCMISSNRDDSGHVVFEIPIDPQCIVLPAELERL